MKPFDSEYCFPIPDFVTYLLHAWCCIRLKLRNIRLKMIVLFSGKSFENTVEVSHVPAPIMQLELPVVGWQNTLQIFFHSGIEFFVMQTDCIVPVIQHGCRHLMVQNLYNMDEKKFAISSLVKLTFALDESTSHDQTRDKLINARDQIVLPGRYSVRRALLLNNKFIHLIYCYYIKIN